MLCRWKQVIRLWKNMRESKPWQNCNFGENYSFKKINRFNFVFMLITIPHHTGKMIQHIKFQGVPNASLNWSKHFCSPINSAHQFAHRKCYTEQYNATVSKHITVFPATQNKTLLLFIEKALALVLCFNMNNLYLWGPQPEHFSQVCRAL